MEQGATSQCRRPLEAGKPCDSSQGNSQLSPPTQRTKSCQKSERGEWKSRLKAQHSENEDHGIQSHHFMGNRWGNSGHSVRLYFSGLQNHCRWWLMFLPAILIPSCVSSSPAFLMMTLLPGAGERHSARDKGHEEGGSAYAKAESSLGSLPRYSRVSSPKKPESAYFIALCSHLWLYWGLSPTTISLSLSKS